MDRQRGVLMLLFVLALVLAPATIGYAQNADGELAPPVATDAPPTLPADEGVAPAIVGGQEATPGEYPWQAFLLIGSSSTGYYMCGGSLIAAQWVLTAAHCVDLTLAEAAVVAPPSMVTVYLGKHNIDINEPTQQIKGVSRVIVHPDYSRVTKENDLALLELNTPATLNARVATIQMVQSPADDALTAPGVLATVIGWGTTAEDGDTSSTLQEVAVPIVSNATCDSALPGPAITQNKICAGFTQGGKDSCQGDSGGPLMVPDGVGGWKQTGIVSYGYGCARPNLYGVYTRVSRYIDWIGQYVSMLTVNGFNPGSGRAGTPVTVTGAGLSSVTAVRFAGTPANFTVTSDAQLVATSPAGAVSGPIALQSPYATVQTASDFLPLYQLDVQTPGNGVVDVQTGDGRVDAAPADARCTSAAPCSLEVVGGQTATLIPTADDGFVFAGWRGGACPVLDGTCAAYIDADRTEIAVFAPPTSTLTVAITGGGIGSVVSSSGIDCGANCMAELPTRTAHTLIAQPDAGMIFTGWLGGCSGLAMTCTVYMVGDQAVEASFEMAQYLHLPIIRR